jgi:hypothetical protein
MFDNTYLWAFVIVGISGVGVLVTCLTFLVGLPPHRLTWNVETTSPLLSEGSDSLDVSYRGQKLEAPCVVEVSLRNVGRKSISSPMFNEDRPMRFNFHVPILALTASSDSDYRIETAGNEVLIHPRTIRPGQNAKFTVLVNGNPDVTLKSPLVDVQTSISNREYGVDRNSIYGRSALLLLAVTTIATIAVSILVWVAR